MPILITPFGYLGQPHYIYIAAMGAHMADAVCRVIGAEDLVGSDKVATFEAQKANEQELRQKISQWALSQDKKTAAALLREADVPAFHIVAPHELFDDPHLLERKFIQRIDQPGYGEIPVFDRPGNDGSRVQIVPAPLLGQYSFDVLHQLGWSAESIVGLHERGIIGHEVANNPSFTAWQQQYGISSGAEFRPH